ncbi:MAG: polysaccharide biosynthesis C-terminal domain-containing protein, partial [Parabacteroides gordonii]|nr:polysaccharide biosynthesis C-terminal domain-containing protein [Parabacteroides gordonii]
MAPIILFISLSGIMCWQILFPLDKEKLVVYATLTGAVVNFILNLLLIPSYSQYGAGVATCIAESLVTITAIVFARRYVSVKFISKQHTLLCSYLFNGGSALSVETLDNRRDSVC